MDLLDRTWLDAAAARYQIPLPSRHIRQIDQIAPRVFRAHTDEHTVVKRLLEQISARNNHLSTIAKLMLLQGRSSRQKVTFNDFCNMIDIVMSERTLGQLEVALELFFQRPLRHTKRHPFHRRKNVGIMERRRFIGAFIERSYKSGQVEMIDLLSRSADPKNVQELLRRAMEDNDLKLMGFALRAHANPNLNAELWEQAVARGDDDFIEALIVAPVPISTIKLSTALTNAVRFRHTSTVLMLLSAGADTNHKAARAFNLAVSTNQYDVVLLMILSEKPPDTVYLDRVVSRLLCKHHKGSECNLEMLETLVRARWSNGETSTPLTAVPLENYLDFCELLVRQHTPEWDGDY